MEGPVAEAFGTVLLSLVCKNEGRWLLSKLESEDTEVSRSGLGIEKVGLALADSSCCFLAQGPGELKMDWRRTGISARS